VQVGKRKVMLVEEWRRRKGNKESGDVMFVPMTCGFHA
jgi:hypothetical protein